MKNNKTNLRHTLLILSCVLLTALGFTILNADSTTTIGLDVSTGDLALTGNVTSGTWQGSVVGTQYGGTGQNFNDSTGIIKLTDGTASVITDNSTDWDTAYTYSQVGHLPLTGGTLSSDLTIQETGDAKITIYSNTDDSTADFKLLVVQKGTDPSELFSVDNEGDIIMAGDLSVSGGELYLTGTDSSLSTTEGTMYYDTDDDQLKVYANDKWQSDRSTATIIVGTSNISGASLNYEKADYVCNGTDDQDTIQTAINALPDGGGKVVLMEGTYNKSNAAGISIPSNVEIEMVSGAVITLVNSVGDGAVIFANADAGGNQNIKIIGGVLDGNLAGQSSATEQIGIYFSNVESSAIDVLFQNFRGKNYVDAHPNPDLSVNNHITNRAYPLIKKTEYNSMDRVFQTNDFQSVDLIEEDWSVWGGQGTIEVDYDDVMVGNNSIKITSASDGAGGGRIKMFKTSSPQNLRDRSIGFWLKASDPYPTSLTMYFELYDAAGKYQQWRKYDMSNYLRGSEWTFVLLDLHNYFSENGIDLANVTKIQPRFFNDDGTGLDWWVKIDGLVSVPKKRVFPNGAVAITFDGPYPDQWDVAAPKMDEYGYAGVIASEHYNNKIDSFSLQQLKRLQNRGWDICIYGRMFDESSPPVPYSRAEIEDSVLPVKNWLIENGFERGARFIQNNRQQHNTYTQKLLAEYFYMIRGRNVPGSSTFSLPFNPMAFMSGSHTLATCKGYVDTAVSNKAFYPFFIHLKPGDSFTEADFIEFIDYVHESGVEVVTYSDLLDHYIFAKEQLVSTDDLFLDILAASATHIRSNEDLSAATPITFTIDAQPDVARSITWAFDSHAEITAFNLEIKGVTARGNTVTETFTEANGWSGETNNAFTTITHVKLTSRTGTGAGDTMDIGIGSKLGTSNALYTSSDVFKVKKNTADYPVASYTVNTTYSTIDVSTGGAINANDDFTIYYMVARIID